MLTAITTKIQTVVNNAKRDRVQEAIDYLDDMRRTCPACQSYASSVLSHITHQQCFATRVAVMLPIEKKNRTKWTYVPSTSSALHAYVCTKCGHVELTAANPERLELNFTSEDIDNEIKDFM